MAKRKEEQGPAFILGIEILDECMCGKQMTRDERQQLKLSSDGTVWFRQCGSCLLPKDNDPRKNSLSTDNSAETP